tara:strand:- start:147 stop:638 length:492 start_codon:yes stop_codon:yes gene_type:complete
MSILNLTYFEIFDINIDISIDTNELEKKYLKLQTKFHPDKYASASNIEKTMAARISTHINDGYKTLSSLILRVDYILKINNFSISEHQTFKNSNFLTEQLELSEKIERTDKIDFPIIQEEIKQKISNLITEMKSNLINQEFDILYDNISMIKFYEKNLNQLSM